MDKQTLKNTVGARIKKIRRALNLTQEQAAEQSGSLTEKRWSEIERGKHATGIDTLQKVADTLGVPLYQLFLFEDAPLPKDGVALSKMEKEITKLKKGVTSLEKEMKAFRKSDK